MPANPPTQDQRLVLLLLLAIVVVGLAFSNLSFAPSPPKNPAVKGVSEDLEAQRRYWEKLVSDEPTYYQGWLELSEINKKTGDEAAAKVSEEEAARLNPSGL